MSISAPTSEIGYTLAPSYSRVPVDDGETTPELVWPQSIYVYDAMRRTDAQVGSVLRAVTETLLRTPWRIDPAGARARVTKFVADDLGLPIVGKNPTPPPRLKDRFSWPSHLREALLMLPLGHAYFEQIYRINEAGTAAHLRKLAYRPAKTIEQINVAPDGGLISIQQYWTATNREPEPIPVNHLVAYIHAKEGGNWLGTSILRNCYKNWLLKDRLLRVQAQTIERNGMGIPLYTAAETETDLSKGLNMATSWRAGEAAGSAVPYGATLKLVGVEGTLPDAEPAIRYHDEQIARAVLAHFLNLGQQTGSWALGTTFADFFTMSLQTLAEQIRDTATQHIVEDLVDINFGEDEPAPRLVFDEIGSRQAATAQAIKTLVDAGVIHPDQVLEESSRQQYGLPPADPATATTPPGAPTATPPAPTQMGDASPSVADPKAVAAIAANPQAATGGTDSEDDEDVTALFAAVAELEVWAAAFDPTKHARNPRGGPGGGRFRSMVDRLSDAVHTWNGGDRKTDPFLGFDREQLRRAAKTRGLPLRRGASRDEIAKALFLDLHKGGAPEPVEKAVEKPAKRAAKKAVKKTAPEVDEPLAPKVSSFDESVKSGVKSSKVLTSSGSGTITLVTFKDGTKAVKKTVHAKGEDGKRQVDAAQLAASVARELHVATPAVHRISDRELYMEYVDGPTAYHDDRMHQRNLDVLHGSEAGQMLGLFDLLIDYDDRSNRENWAFNKRNQIVALDHDTAWAEDRDPAKPPQETWAHSPFFEHWLDGKNWKANDLSPAVAATIRQRLEGLRPEFEQHGRGAWLDFALSRLAAIEAHSTSRRTVTAAGVTDGADLDEEADDWEEAIAALILALEELSAGRVEAAWDPSRHARNPKGSPGGGRFRSMVDRLKDAIDAHTKGGGKGHPFDEFDREQLRRVARARGIELKRGESRDSIAEKLLGHLGENGKPKAPAVAPKPARRPRVLKAVPAPARPWHLDLDGVGDLAGRVQSTEFRKAPREAITEGVEGAKEKVTLPDGTAIFTKTLSGSKWRTAKEVADAEQLAALVAHKVLGAPTPRVYRDREDRINTDWVSGKSAWRTKRTKRYQRATESRGAIRIGLLDLLTQNSDRHEGNLILDTSGELHGIDHGHSWSGAELFAQQRGTTGPLSPLSQFLFWAGPMAGQHFIGRPVQLKPNALTSRDITKLRRRLEKLRPDFQQVGRGMWLDNTLSVVDALEPHAKGEVDVLD
jgi:hypothetical protein